MVADPVTGTPLIVPLWATAGALDVPVLIHVADPAAFFDPLDATNECFEELNAHPDWQFPSPPFMKIMTDLKSLVSRHRGII